MEHFKTPKGTILPILNLRGKPYLQVAHRIVWFREEHPDWQILTECIKMDPEFTIFKASIISSEEPHRCIAMAHKREDKASFADHMEKAETASIGRALALCGYGTQFAEITEDDRIVDAPIDPANRGAKEVLGMVKDFYTAPRTVSVPSLGDNSSPGDYVIKFGKYKDKKIKELTMDNGETYFTFLSESAAKDGKPMSPGARDFCVNWQKYRETRKPSKIEELQAEDPGNFNDANLPF